MAADKVAKQVKPIKSKAPAQTKNAKVPVADKKQTKAAVTPGKTTKSAKAPTPKSKLTKADAAVLSKAKSDAKKASTGNKKASVKRAKGKTAERTLKKYKRIDKKTGESYGKYNGITPGQATKKMFSRYVKDNKAKYPNGETPHMQVFIRESTQKHCQENSRLRRN